MSQGVVRLDGIDWGMNNLAASGSIAMTQNDLTVEKKSSVISFNGGVPINPNALYTMFIEKSVNNTAGDMTLKIYNTEKYGTTTASDTLHNTLTVERTEDASTFRTFLVQGLWMGSEEEIKLGGIFSTDTGGGSTVNYRIYRM